MKVGIYKIISPSGAFYIGQSINIPNRFSRYKNLHCEGQRHLYNSFIKYGVSAHEFEIIHELPPDVSNDILFIYEELYYNLYLDVGKKSLNIRYPSKKSPISQETKMLISKAKIGHKHTELTKYKLSIKSTGNINMKGKKHTYETRLKISKKVKGVNKNKKATSETKNKMSIYSKNRSESHRKKLAASRCKKVFQYSLDKKLIREWPSLKEATLCNNGDIKGAIYGNQKTAGGYIWAYNYLFNCE